MTWKSIASRGGKVITDLAIRVHESVTEQDVFAALGQMCAQTGSAIALAGYVVALNGKTVRRATPPDPMFDGADADQLAAWLVDGRSPDLIFPGPAFGASRQFHRLTKDHRVLGGLILAGVEADTATLRACRMLSQLAASAIAGLQKRRLSHMVLEALQQSEEAISFYDEHEGVIFTNEAYHRIFPHYPPPAELVGRSHLDLYRLDLEAGIIDDPVARRDPEVYLAERAQRSRLLVQRQREIQKLASKTYIYTRTRSQTGATMSRRIDITEQAATEARLVERERELHTLAFQDPLTALYNRAYLKDRLAFLQARLADRTLDGIAVFLFDLNGFKLINDTYGHECCDQVLKTIAARLSRSLSAGNTVVRLGGDEFIILFERDVQEDELAGIAEEAIAAVSEPVHHGELSLRVGTSIGIALASGPGCDAGSIIGDADIAMYEAKRQKFNAFRFFHPSMRAAMVGRLGMADDLREALKNDQFELHYQPQFVTETGALVGFEALVRWRHPTRGLVPPSDFIPIMEDYGLIEALGDWVLATACAEACAWPSQLRLAVNVSPLQVRSGRFSLKLCKTLLASGLPPHRLELEITESVFLNDEARTRVELDDWKVLGVRIALDDFGRGYSSLSYLTAFPIDKIKIDRKFVAECDPDQPDGPAAVILRALIDLSRALKIGVTAEGVERPDQLAFLRRHGCGEVQGYLLGRPMPVDAVRRFLTAQDLAVPAA